MSPKQATIAAMALVAALSVFGSTAAARTTGGGEVLTNEKIISLVRSRLSDALIKRIVSNASRTQFDMTVEGVLKLQDAGTSEEIIAAMMDIFQKEETTRDRSLRIHIQMLRSDVPTEYDRAVRELVRHGAYAVPLLVEQVVNDDERVRAGCLEVLGRIADPPSVESVYQCLIDRNQAVRAKAARAISMFDKTVVGPRVAAGIGRQGSVRDGYALALGYLGDLTYQPLLLRVADGPGSEVDRAAASYALGLLGDPQPMVVRTLIEGVLNDTFRDLREASARALGRLATRMDADTKDEVCSAMAKSVQRYKSGRDILILQLRHLPSRQTVEVLLEYLSNRDRSVAGSCWEALKSVTGEDYPQDVAQWRSWWQIASGQPRWRPYVRRRTSVPTTNVESTSPSGETTTAPAETETAPPVPEDPFVR